MAGDMSAFHKRPADKDGSGYIQVESHKNPNSGSVGNKYHERPGSKKGTEFSVVTDNGTGKCKG